MATKTQARREDLRSKLVTLAEATIAETGLASLKARDLAKAADCSVGAIYNVFKDLNGLILHVNGVTFRRLGAQVTGAISGMDDTAPCERLIALSHAYLDFAQNNYRLWNALFGIKMTTDSEIPDWYQQTLEDLFAHIHKPVAEIFPDMASANVHLMTRGLFSSVHGVVLLGLQQRVPVQDISRMLTLILSNIGQNKVF